MSNVHGFGQGPSNRNGPNNPNQQPPPYRPANNQPIDDGNGGFFEGFAQPVIEDQLRMAQENKVLFISGMRTVKNPREENYWDMLTYSLCPTFSFLSLTFLILIADIVVFIYLASIGLDTSSDNLLQIKTQTLIDHGGNYQAYELLYRSQVYRFLSAIFVHIHFMHIFGNVITTFMFLSRIEYTYGIVKTLIIYLVSGIAGNIFSVLLNPGSVKAGASTALYGVIGIIIGYIIINWNGLDLVGPAMKCQIWCTGLMIIIFIFIFTPSNSGSIDYFGHLGGFMAGLWLSSIHQTIIHTAYEKWVRIVFFCLLLIQLGVSFGVFYSTQTPIYSCFSKLF